MGRPVINMLGRRFGRLVVTGPGRPDSHGARWVCRCDCGNTTDTPGGELRHGGRESCGCATAQAILDRIAKISPRAFAVGRMMAARDAERANRLPWVATDAETVCNVVIERDARRIVILKDS